MLKATLAALLAVTVSANVAQVHEHIKDENCKENYIRGMKPACVIPSSDGTGKCFPHGTDILHGCVSTPLKKSWQWTHLNDATMQYAPGTNPPPHRRMTHNGGDTEKLVWSYAAYITQAKAVQIYGLDGSVSVEAMSKSPINQVSMISNVLVAKPSGWFEPGKNNTEGCGQRQTVKLPFGYDSNKTTQTEFHANLAQLKQMGVTITMTLGSWCTSFPVLPSEEWSDSQFQQFVSYFEHVKETIFGGYLDGVDFDWEGFCRATCLREQCACAWDTQRCGKASPEELAAGINWNTTDWTGKTHKHECWIMPTKSTMQIIGGISHFMKKAGHVVTLVPMSTAMYTSKPDSSPKQYMRNEYVKWSKQTYEGQAINFLDVVDGALLQWYSGFDAALCTNTDDPKACTCDNVQLADYPNVYNNTNFFKNNTVAASFAFYVNGRAGNMFPSSFPVRCQACGKGNDIIRPDGTKGPYPCAPKDEQWVRASIGSGENASNPLYQPLVDADNKGYDAYSAAHPNELVHWWVQDVEIPQKCPRAIDCPDWRYHGEEPYSRQLKLLKSLNDVIDLNKVSIGFETLGTDVLVQMEGWQDATVMWPNTSPKEHMQHIYYKPCKTNGTKGEKSSHEPHERCSNPLMEQQWGLKFNASEIIGLEAAVQSQLGKTLAGVGTFTLDGMIWAPAGKQQRLWYPELCKLNEHYKLRQKCDIQPGPSPSPSGQCTGCASGTSGECKTKTTNVCYPKNGGMCPGGTFPCTTKISIN